MQVEMTPEEFFSEVVRSAPSFEAVQAEHKSTYGELLGHLLIADLWRYLVSHFSGVSEAPRPRSDAEIRDVFRVIDRGLREGDSSTEDMIAVSFVENCEYTEGFAYLAPYFGDAMKAELKRQQAWSPAAGTT